MLVIMFLLMQIGFSLYFQFIIVQMKYAHEYSNWQLGAVRGMIGLFVLGLLIGMPLVLKYWSVKRIALITGILTGIGQIIAAISTVAITSGVLAVFIAAVDIMVFTAMLTLFSDAVDKNMQSWVMGIANAVMALSWAIKRLSSNLLDLLGTRGLILIGGVCLIVGSLMLWDSKDSNNSGNLNMNDIPLEKLPSERQPVLRLKTLPNDANYLGDIFGGWVMSQIDIAGAIVASERAKGPVVTVAVKELLLLKPIYVYDFSKLICQST